MKIRNALTAEDTTTITKNVVIVVAAVAVTTAATKVTITIIQAPLASMKAGTPNDTEMLSTRRTTATIHPR